MSIKTKDGVTARSGMTVFGLSPFDEIETLYVEDDVKWASTDTPYNRNDHLPAASCRFETAGCFSTFEAARAALDKEEPQSKDAYGKESSDDKNNTRRE